MTEGYEVPGRPTRSPGAGGRGAGGAGATETQVLEALRRVDWDGPEDDLDVADVWARGRTRRARKRGGALAAAGLAAAVTVAAVWSSGLLGGARAPDSNVAAVIPAGMTTFVFAAPDAPDADPATVSALQVPSPEDLRGTSWTLTDDLWGGGAAADVVGADPASTVLTFGDGAPARPGWGFMADECGGGWFQDDLVLDRSGAFPPGDLGSDDQGCPPAAQDAEDFWLEALSHGGRLHELGGGAWLLVSVELPTSDVAVGPTTESAVGPTTDAPTPDPPMSTPPTSDPPTSDPPTSDPPTTDTPTTDTPTSDPPASDPPTQDPTGEEPTGTSDEPLPGFVPVGTVDTHGDWSAGGGDLLAPAVRAGRNDGFDRVVVDLTGTDALGWRASYTDVPTLDPSGLPSDIAGDQVLEVWLSGMGYPEPGSTTYSEGIFGLDTHTLARVVEVQRTTPFEGRLQVFVGVTGVARPYRIFELDAPRRLVIDIQH